MAKKTETVTHEITIAGSRFSVPLRYAAGHVLNDGEANALNQTMLENIRNNNAAKAKAGELTQAMVDDYAANYQFGERQGFAAINPVEAMALTIARKKVKGKGLSAAEITAAARDLLASDRGAAIMKAAKVMVEA
jgi:outer membrane receptor for Fe3+-dicitrate